MEGRRRDRTPAVLPQPAMTTPGDCPLAEVTSSSRFERDAEYGPRVPTRSIGALAGGGGPAGRGRSFGSRHPAGLELGGHGSDLRVVLLGYLGSSRGGAVRLVG